MSYVAYLYYRRDRQIVETEHSVTLQCNGFTWILIARPLRVVELYQSVF